MKILQHCGNELRAKFVIFIQNSGQKKIQEQKIYKKIQKSEKG